jgi:2-C-methyl-D-erythritol 4-phosphate cytidylyltransferase
MGTDKIWADLCGQPLISWPIRAFAATSSIDDLVLVVRQDAVQRTQELLEGLGITGTVIVGGARRQDSVRAGLDAAERADWVVVHDGDRPLVTPDLIRSGLAASAETGAAIAAVPVVDTIKRVEHAAVVATLDRESLWAAQTPQVFRRSVLVAAHQSNALATDDAVLVEALGVPVRVYMGGYGNIKITNTFDLWLAELLLASVDLPAGAASHPITR